MRSEAFVEDPLLSKDVDLENEEWLSTTTSDERRQSPLRAKFSQCNATCIFLVAIIVSMLIYFGFVFDKRQTDQECAAQLSIWSPVLEAVEYVSYDFSNAFDGKSPFRGPPTAELEARWENLTFKHAVTIPPERFKDLNRWDDTHYRPNPDGYGALVEVFHQLHCLNILRQYTWLLAGKYDRPPPSLSSSEVGNRMHADHCIETIRLSLMCHADVTPLLVVEDPNSPLGSKADFNSYHKCRNFDKISQWMDENWTVE